MIRVYTYWVALMAIHMNCDNLPKKTGDVRVGLAGWGFRT